MLVDFYQLTVSPLERVLPRICERLIGEGERLLIVAEADQIDRLDAQLWTYARDAFLPHGRVGGDRAEAQPILLSSEPDAVNGAANIALADGRWRDKALGFGRVFYFFDNARIEDARASWRALGQRSDVQRRYWKQEGGKWIQGP